MTFHMRRPLQFHPSIIAISLPSKVPYLIIIIILIFFFGFCFVFVVCLFVCFNSSVSSSICKLPIRSEIYNCTVKNTNKVSIIIIIIT